MLKLNALQSFAAFGSAVFVAAVMAVWSVSALSTDATGGPRNIERAELAEINVADRTNDAIRIKTILAPDSEILARSGEVGDEPSEAEIAALLATPPDVIATGKENGRSFALLRGGDSNVRLAVGEVWNDWKLNRIEGVAAYFSREGQAFDHVFFAPSEDTSDEG